MKEEIDIDKFSKFKYSLCILEKNEYAKIISEINNNYSLYKGKRYAIHYSIGMNECYYAYYFENYGFNNYNILEKFEV